MPDRVSVEQLRQARDSVSSVVDTCNKLLGLLDADKPLDPEKFQRGVTHAIRSVAAVSMVALTERIMILMENEDA